MYLKFAKTGLKNKKLDNLFLLNENTHKRKTRDDDKYQVEFANTDRLKQLSIITMQNILNDDAKKKTICSTLVVVANYDLLSDID